jgi:hypothetical protein
VSAPTTQHAPAFIKSSGHVLIATVVKRLSGMRHSEEGAQLGQQYVALAQCCHPTSACREASPDELSEDFEREVLDTLSKREA